MVGVCNASKNPAGVLPSMPQEKEKHAFQQLQALCSEYSVLKFNVIWGHAVYTISTTATLPLPPPPPTAPTSPAPALALPVCQNNRSGYQHGQILASRPMYG